MKKVFILAAAAAMIAACGCKNDKSASVPEEAGKAVETPVPANPAKKNFDDGIAFIDSIKANDKDVKTTESGLVYKVLSPGEGAAPELQNTAKVRYTGKHIDGSVFDSSGDDTVEFPVRGVVPGFAEALMLMHKGEKLVAYIPGNLAYGQRGTPGGPIGPNETLVFEIELVDFN